MEVFEITAFTSGVNRSGVNYLLPSDSFQDIQDGFIYRQVLQSRKGMTYYCPRLAGGTRIMGIWDYVLPDGSRQCLAADKNHLYRYNSSTNVFNQLAFGGSLAAYGGFNIVDNESYISGCAYPDSANSGRFILCGKGIAQAASGSSIFFYDGSVVKDYTSVVDNPKYVAPTGGALARANSAVFFNGRINFIVPTIVTALNQGVLYSGIQNTLGNGDNFNVAGSGVIQFSTSQLITGANILGQLLVILLQESSTALQITTDAFNPYRILNIPGVIGTDAGFSSVGWADQIISISREGIINTDGRQSLRVDNKIYDFTKNNIDQSTFALTYGGFDRINSQFLWAYKKSGGSSSSVQDSILVRDYEEDTWAVFNLSASCFGYTYSGQDLSWNQIQASSGNPSWARWDTTEESWNKIGLGSKVGKTLAGDDDGFVYEMNRESDDLVTSVTGITNGAQALLSIATPTALQVGDMVAMADVVGMTQINSYNPESAPSQNVQLWPVVATTINNITLGVDTSTFGVYTSGGILSRPIKFYAKTIPLNPYRSIGRKFFISHIEFLIDCTGGFLRVDVFQNLETTPFKSQILVKPSSQTKAREWVTMSVDCEADFFEFALTQSSPSVSLRITSIRIHGDQGAFTGG